MAAFLAYGYVNFASPAGQPFGHGLDYETRPATQGSNRRNDVQHFHLETVGQEWNSCNAVDRRL